MSNRRHIAVVLLVSPLILVTAIGLWLTQDRSRSSTEDTVWSRLLDARTRKDYRTVSQCLDGIDLSNRMSVDERVVLADELCESGRFSAAERLFTQVLEASPDSKVAHRKLGILKHITGRPDLAREHWRYLLRFGGMDLLTFPLVRNLSLRLPDQDKALERGLNETPGDPLACLGLAVRALHQSRLDECHTLLENATATLHTKLCLAELLHRQGDIGGLSRVLSEVGTSGESYSAYWIMRGHLHRNRNEISPAARCYWEACRSNPNSYSATEELARCLRELQHPDEADRLIARARTLMNYQEVCRAIHHSHEILERHLVAAEQYAVDLRFTADALTWCQFARIAFPKAGWPQEHIVQHQHSMRSPPTRSQDEFDLRDQIDLSHIPLPALTSDYQSLRTDETASAEIRFEDRAAALGISFVYADGADSSTVETALFEFTGGGIAVIDYDQDAWPDLFFPQGASSPFETKSQTAAFAEFPADLLARNSPGDSFAGVTSLARIHDAAYSQGVTTGDFNSDGWCDLYIANIGSNCLLMNSGDGTFLQIDDTAINGAASWTTSCALVDLNGDGLPDLYDANYVPLDSANTLMCRNGDASVPCGARPHPSAAQDQLLINNGDGTFANVTETAGITLPDGLALGLIAADFDQNGSLDIFVANDGKRNFLFLNQSLSPLRFEDEALQRGLAYSGSGRAQACMGVAAEDFTGDGLLDLFITNFYADYNIFYRQLPGPLFRDETSDRGLYAASYYLLGFGAQALDADLDGNPDIILTNGDVADFSAATPGRLYRQSPQFLLNHGNGQFREVPAEQLGEFFQGKYLGRGLARLDYNRDGREDFAVSHIGSSAALVANRTTSHGHFLSLQLVGTTSARDAVGAQVTVRSNSTEWNKQLTGGDGYMASNQRRLHFGTGPYDHPVTVRVTWPSRTIEEFGMLALDREYVLVEGSGTAWRLPRPVQ